MKTSHPIVSRSSIGLSIVAMVVAGIVTMSAPASASARPASTGSQLGTFQVGVRSHSTSQALSGCQADGAIIQTAMMAFKSEKPGVLVTKIRLTGTSEGGPYINGWPNRAPFYSFSINGSGVLELAIPDNGRKYVYTGPNSCEKLKDVTNSDIRVVLACTADGATVAVAMAAFSIATSRRQGERKSTDPVQARWFILVDMDS